MATGLYEEGENIQDTSSFCRFFSLYPLPLHSTQTFSSMSAIVNE